MFLCSKTAKCRPPQSPKAGNTRIFLVLVAPFCSPAIGGQGQPAKNPHPRRGLASTLSPGMLPYLHSRGLVNSLHVSLCIGPNNPYSSNNWVVCLGPMVRPSVKASAGG